MTSLITRVTIKRVRRVIAEQNLISVHNIRKLYRFIIRNPFLIILSISESDSGAYTKSRTYLKTIIMSHAVGQILIRLKKNVFMVK